jgi:segregation and condensation protein A
MAELLTSAGDRLQRSRQALITFLSLLELGKLGFVGLYQTENYGDIHIQGKKEIDGDVLSKVEEYGVINNEDIAEQLFAKQILTETEMAEAEDFTLETTPANFAETEISEITDGVATDEEILAAEAELEMTEPVATMTSESAADETHDEPALITSEPAYEPENDSHV